MSTKIAIIGPGDGKTLDHSILIGQKNLELFNEIMTEEALKEVFKFNKSSEPIAYIAQKFETLADLNPVIGKSRQPFTRKQKDIRNTKKKLSKLARKRNRK